MLHFGRIESLSQWGWNQFIYQHMVFRNNCLNAKWGIFLSIIYLSKCVGIHCLLDVLINEIFDSENVCFFFVWDENWFWLTNESKYSNSNICTTLTNCKGKSFSFKYTPKSVKLLLEISATKSNRLNTNIDTCQATIVHANALIFFYYLQNRFTSISRLETEKHVGNVITKKLE